MQTCAEQLPVEIWLMIFRYLEAHDLFHAFNNLNYYFNRILTSNHLLFYVRLKETDNNHQRHPINPYWSDFILNHTICLQPFVRVRSTYFLQFLYWHVNKLIRLQSLWINIYPRTTLYVPYICQALKQLNVLRYLSMICIPNENLLKSILSIPTLCICQLTFRESMAINYFHSNVNSNIKQLFIIFLENINYSLINHLFIYTPKLKRLEISGSSFSFDQILIFDKKLFILPELEIFKFKLDNGYFLSNCFKCLHTTMPVLKYFYFNYNRHILSETFLDFFISYWWSIIEQIQYIHIYIRGHTVIDITTNNNSNIETVLKRNRESLLAKNNQTNGCFKVEWTEQVFNILKLITITIVKS